MIISLCDTMPLEREKISKSCSTDFFRADCVLQTIMEWRSSVLSMDDNPQEAGKNSETCDAGVMLCLSPWPRRSRAMWLERSSETSLHSRASSHERTGDTYMRLKPKGQTEQRQFLSPTQSHTHAHQRFTRLRGRNGMCTKAEVHREVREVCVGCTSFST